MLTKGICFVDNYWVSSDLPHSSFFPSPSSSSFLMCPVRTVQSPAGAGEFFSASKVLLWLTTQSACKNKTIHCKVWRRVEDSNLCPE